MLERSDEERLGMDLACRAYLYSLFHVVFAGQCDEAALSNMFAPRTKELFGRVSAWRHAASKAAADAAGLDILVGKDARSLDVCADELLGCIDAHSWVASAAEGDSEAQDESRRARLDELSAMLKGDYDRLFQVPGERYVRPWESPYVNAEGTLFQRSTIDVRTYYHDASFKLRAEQHFPDDHIAAMMDYLGKMGQRAYDAFADGNDSECRDLLLKQRDFLRVHVLTWIDAFAAKVIENDEHAVYAAFASGMAVLAHADAAHIEGLIAPFEGEPA